jgi:hypothetical protein
MMNVTTRGDSQGFPQYRRAAADNTKGQENTESVFLHTYRWRTIEGNYFTAWPRYPPDFTTTIWQS